MSTHRNTGSNHPDRPSAAKRQRLSSRLGAEVIADEADNDDEEESFLLSSSFQSQSQSQSQSQGCQSQGLDLTQNSQESDRTARSSGRVSPTHPAPMYRLPVPPPSSIHEEEPCRSPPPPPPPPISASVADDTTETVASVVQKLNAITSKINNNDQRVAAAAAAAIVPPHQHATIIRLLKLLRRWSETESKRTLQTTTTKNTNFFQQFQLPDVQGMACLTQLLDYLVRTHQNTKTTTKQTPPWESLKYIGRIVNHCTNNGPDGQHRTTAATLATKFIAQGGMTTLVTLAFGEEDEEDGYTSTNAAHDGKTKSAAIATTATATTAATVLTDKFRAILYIWGGLMNVLSHKRVVETNVLDAKVSVLVYQCGMQTIRWVHRHKNRDTTAENRQSGTPTTYRTRTTTTNLPPYDAILKNVFGTLGNVLQFQTSRSILAKISDYAITGTRDDPDHPVVRRTLLSIIFNEAVRTKRTNTNAEPTTESEEEESHDDDENDVRSTLYDWDYNVHTWKKAAFLLYLCYVKTHPPILPLEEDTARQHRSCRDDVARVSAFCVEFMRHDPNEAYRSNTFALLHTFIAEAHRTGLPVAASSQHQGERDEPPNRIRNTHDLMITLGTILDSRPDSFGTKYSIDPRTKEAARKVLRALL